jgi:nucleotide-binding universal stress UspA family protein
MKSQCTNVSNGEAKIGVDTVSHMVGFSKILVPVDFSGGSEQPSLHAVQQAAWLARRFGSEIALLHVVTPVEYPAGWLERGDEITARDLHSRAVQGAQRHLESFALSVLNGIQVTRELLRGDPAREIVKASDARGVDLIVMPTRGETLFGFLLGSVTAKVLHETACPVWTGAHLEKTVARDFSVRNILCSVTLNAHNRHTLSRAAELAAAIDGRLTLVHITSSVERFGPGGTYVNAEWQKELVGAAAEEIARLQTEAGTNAEVVIDSGDAPQLLNDIAAETNADLLVIGHIPGRSHWGDNGNGYDIIRKSKIPVLSV